MAMFTIDGLTFAIQPEPTDEEYRQAVVASVLREGAECLWCRSRETGQIQELLSLHGTQGFEAWHCFACGSRFSPQAVGFQMAYGPLSQRHAWYRIAQAISSAVRDLLCVGSEPAWAYSAARLLDGSALNNDRRYREFLSQVIRAAQDGQRLSILEVGCGQGFAGGIAARLGHSYTGVDIDADGIAYATEQFGEFGAQYQLVAPDWTVAERGPERYDLVFSSEVIEHLDHPLDHLRTLVELTKPAGNVVLTTPDLDRFRFRVWAGDPPPIHTVFLNRHAITAAANTLMSKAQVECFNEDFGPDWTRVVTEETLSPAPALIAREPGPVQVDPLHPEFSYTAEKLAESLQSLPRYDGYASHTTNLRSSIALTHELRLLGAALIVVISVP